MNRNVKSFMQERLHTEPDFTTTNGDVPMFQIGNGSADANRSDAFEVSGNGHSIVYDNLGTDWTQTPIITSTVSSRPAVRGSRNIDNTCIAWADIPAGVADGPIIPTASYGIRDVTRTGNKYTITLDYVDPSDQTKQVQIQFGAAIVVSPVYNGNGCVTATPSHMSWVDTDNDGVKDHNQFSVWTWTSGASCTNTNNEFMFHVYGRPCVICN